MLVRTKTPSSISRSTSGTPRKATHGKRVERLVRRARPALAAVAEQRVVEPVELVETLAREETAGSEARRAPRVRRAVQERKTPLLQSLIRVDARRAGANGSNGAHLLPVALAMVLASRRRRSA